tara:strand:- start:5084 stop:5413 length:330 start_codon:yes stop_codon:yes gene_type:complete
MRVRSQIVLLAILLFSCKKVDTPVVTKVGIDTVLIKSIENTNTFTLIIEDVDSVELELWASIGFKIDSLVKRNRELEINCGNNWRPRVIDKNGNIKILPPISDLKKKKQ